MVGRRISRVVQRWTGVRQGRTLSPRLFSLYINNIEEYLEQKKVLNVKLFTANMILFLFADDTALLADSKENFQKLLNLALECF